MGEPGKRIAVVGAGASGLISAWLLDARHDVTVFEQGRVAGGNVRTLGGNVECSGLPPGGRLEAGVVEFDQLHFPRFHALMAELGVEMREVPVSTGLFLADGSSWHSPYRLAREYPSCLRRSLATLRHVPLLRARRRFLARTEGLSEEALAAFPLDHFLGDDVFAVWARLLMTYGYSLPYARVGSVGAALAVPTLRSFLVSSRWTSIVGGTWTYVERLLARLRRPVRMGARVVRVAREDGVWITVEGEDPQRFDAVVLSVTPECVLGLLVDPNEDERRRFSGWRTNEVQTLVHTDTGLYERRGIRYFSEFDLFTSESGTGGYNAYLNRLCGVPEGAGVHYGLALGLEDEIDPARVLHAQTHVTPSYGVDGLRTRREVREHNGARNTWYAGAWLGDGLQEGAVTSAEAVAVRLGGRRIADVQAARTPPEPGRTP